MQYLSALFLLSSSCAAPHVLPPRLWDWDSQHLPLTVVFHKDVSPATALEVLSAIEWWETQTDEDLFGDYGTVTTGAILVVLPLPDGVDAKYAGMTNKAGITVGIYIREGASNVFRVICHELGHALGLPHNSDTHSVMYDTAISGEFEVTDIDMELLPVMN